MNVTANDFFGQVINHHASLQDLIEGKARIATRATWTKGHFARDAKGLGTSTEVYGKGDRDPVCWCALGATYSTRNAAWAYLNEANRLLYINGSVATTNDKLGFDAVHAMYDLAIILAREDAEEASAPPVA